VVILDKAPSGAIIDTLAGVLDFYNMRPNPVSERSIPICRTWPRYRPEAYPDTSKIMQPFFAYIGKMSPEISPGVEAAYQLMAGGTGLTFRDYMTRCYLSKGNI